MWILGARWNKLKKWKAIIILFEKLTMKSGIISTTYLFRKKIYENKKIHIQQKLQENVQSTDSDEKALRGAILSFSFSKSIWWNAERFVIKYSWWNTNNFKKRWPINL